MFVSNISNFLQKHFGTFKRVKLANVHQLQIILYIAIDGNNMANAQLKVYNSEFGGPSLEMREQGRFHLMNAGKSEPPTLFSV